MNRVFLFAGMTFEKSKAGSKAKPSIEKFVSSEAIIGAKNLDAAIKRLLDNDVFKFYHMTREKGYLYKCIKYDKVKELEGLSKWNQDREGKLL